MGVYKDTFTKIAEAANKREIVLYVKAFIKYQDKCPYKKLKPVAGYPNCWTFVCGKSKDNHLCQVKKCKLWKPQKIQVPPQED